MKVKKQEPTYKIKVSAKEFNLISKALIAIATGEMREYTEKEKDQANNLHDDMLLGE